MEEKIEYLKRGKDYFAMAITCWIPIIIAETKSNPYIVGFISAIIIILSILPYIIAHRCILDVIFTKHPIKNTIGMYKRHPSVYYIIVVLIVLTIFNYLFAFNIL